MQHSHGGPAHIAWLNDHRHDPHVKPINDYVDVLNAHFRPRVPGFFVPYVSPQYGGTKARLLALHRSPGVKTDPHKGGSGYLDYENADVAAMRHREFLEGAGIDVSDVLSWNSMPWIDPDFQHDGQRKSATNVLAKIIGFLEQPVVVMLHGREASDLWREFERDYPQAAKRLMPPVDSYSLGGRLIDPAEKTEEQIARANDRLARDFQTAARLLAHRT